MSKFFKNHTIFLNKIIHVLGGVTPPRVIVCEKSPRESTDLEQYIILGTKNFIWLQKLAKLQKFEIFKKVQNLKVSEYGKSEMVADHRELLLITDDHWPQ